MVDDFSVEFTISNDGTVSDETTVYFYKEQHLSLFISHILTNTIRQAHTQFQQFRPPPSFSRTVGSIIQEPESRKYMLIQ